MNDLKESQETMKQTTDELKKQQDELKNIVDTINQEKEDWVYTSMIFF
jgi:FtsZ-binding cell division protein ZapB